jgi:hypothetical protein
MVTVPEVGRSTMRTASWGQMSPQALQPKHSSSILQTAS